MPKAFWLLQTYLPTSDGFVGYGCKSRTKSWRGEKGEGVKKRKKTDPGHGRKCFEWPAKENWEWRESEESEEFVNFNLDSWFDLISYWIIWLVFDFKDGSTGFVDLRLVFFGNILVVLKPPFLGPWQTCANLSGAMYVLPWRQMQERPTGNGSVFLFSPYLGGMESNFTSIFFRWVGSTTTKSTSFCWTNSFPI